LTKNNSHRRRTSSIHGWVIQVSLWTFIFTLIFAFVLRILLQGVESIFFSFLLLIFVIFVGIFFDTIGIAVAAASEAPFHAKASKKVFGAKKGIYLVRYAEKVSNFCCDVVGDISGVVSGVIGAVIVINLALTHFQISEIYLSIVLTAAVASLTVGGKAVGKYIAIYKSTEIVMFVAQFLATFERIFKRENKVKPN